jgi:outer membrane receptor protein involved in Fe transport
MKKLLIILSVFSPIFSKAQVTPNQVNIKLDGEGKISGVLVDSTTSEPVEFATISLYSLKDLKKPIDGAMTDEKGKFNFKNIPQGKFTLKFTSMGFSEKTVSEIEVSSKNKSINLGSILISADTKMLNEVVVSGQSAVIEEKVDRIIYNADKDISSKGGDASDILRKVPLLSVDLDGNVQLRGSSNIRVLINNKPSTIMAASVADALKQIPADQIKTVEVITSPSAKYDAEGSTGIINIITKKNNIEGYTLNTDIGAGNRGANLGLNGSLKSGKFGMNLGGFGRMNYNPSSTEFEQISKNPELKIKTLQFGDATDRMSFGRYTLGADYDIKKNKSLSAGARFGTRSFNRNQDLTIERYLNETLINTTEQNIISKNPGHSWDFNLDYLHIIKPQKEFSISTLYSRSTANSSFSNSPLSTDQTEILENLNDNINQEYTIQADYQTPIKKNQLFEVGGKGIFRTVNSDFGYLLRGTELNDPGKPTGSLDYFQNIGATYISYTYSTKSKYTIKAGARYEITDIAATQNQTIEIDVPAYSNLVPSFNISKTFGGKYTVKAGYNKRIQRPGLQQLNPNINFTNPNNPTQGNPELRPELTDNIEASVSASIKKFYLNMALFSRVTNNSIQQITFPLNEGSGTYLTTFNNVGKDKAYGVNLNGNFSITPKWMVNTGIEAFYNFINGQALGLSGLSEPIASQGWNLNGRLMTFATLKKGWQVQAFSFVRGSRVTPQGRQGGFGFYSLGMRKEFKNKKGSIGMSAQNFLTKSLNIRNSTESAFFTQKSINYMYNRGVSINLSYRLGKMGMDAMQPKKRAKGVKNDDVKDGGGDQQQGGGQPASGRN